jgi:hypothetical protein
MSLSLIGIASPSPLPSLEIDGARRVRRPGEHHEALAISADVAGELAASAAAAGVSIDAAITLLVEARMALDWLQAAGISAEQIEVQSGQMVALSAAEAGYVRALTMLRGSVRRVSLPAPGCSLVVSVPVRLVARCSPDLLARAARGDLGQAIRWEVAAVREGLSMGEWLTRQAVRTVQGRG